MVASVVVVVGSSVVVVVASVVVVVGAPVVPGPDVVVGPVVTVVTPPDPGGRGMMSPVMASTVVFGGSLTRISAPVSRSMMRARTGSGRSTEPSMPRRTTPAGWLGGTSTVRPSESVGGVTPSLVGIASRGGSSVWLR